MCLGREKREDMKTRLRAPVGDLHLRISCLPYLLQNVRKQTSTSGFNLNTVLLENALHSGWQKVVLKKSQKFFGVLAAACECAHQVLATALQSEPDSGTMENRSLVSNMLSQPL